MSSLQGYMTCTYADLFAAFGTPSEGDTSKCDAEWEVAIPGLGLAYVYNWKNGRNFQGPTGPAVGDITDWNIGGDSTAVVGIVAERVRDANPNAHLVAWTR